MDTRAFRLDWPSGTQVFEADFADVLAFRNATPGEPAAVPGTGRTEVAVDLRDDWPASNRRPTPPAFSPCAPMWDAAGWSPRSSRRSAPHGTPR